MKEQQKEKPPIEESESTAVHDTGKDITGWMERHVVITCLIGLAFTILSIIPWLDYEAPDQQGGVVLWCIGVSILWIIFCFLKLAK